MRLLHIKEDGTFSLVDVVDTKTTPYAILSHTWGDSEVTYKEFLEGTGQTKAGYTKIRACAEKTAEKGLKYFWVDTCCIDKSSSAELSEAINTMYRWYQEAEICFAYLEDAPLDLFNLERSTNNIRWFTRGWTLQELLAPREVEFFDSEWSALGTRTDHAAQLSKMTRIHAEALQCQPDHITTRPRTNSLIAYKPIRSFSIAQRMSWAAERITTRSEDIAYCLLGIFDVNMPLLYGEGPTKAFVRLQEEIMKDSNDQSLFAWCRYHADINHDETHSLLAESPSDFGDSAFLVPVIDSNIKSSHAMTNNGLRITLQMTDMESYMPNVEESYHVHIALLGCVDCSNAEGGRVIALALRSLSDDRYGRVAFRSLRFEELIRDLPDRSFPSILLCTSKTIYVPKTHHLASHNNRPKRVDRVWVHSQQAVYGSEGRVSVVRVALPTWQRETIAALAVLSLHVALADLLFVSVLAIVFVPANVLFKVAICLLIILLSWYLWRQRDYFVIPSRLLATLSLLLSLITGCSMALCSAVLCHYAVVTIPHESLRVKEKLVEVLLKFPALYRLILGVYFVRRYSSINPRGAMFISFYVLALEFLSRLIFLDIISFRTLFTNLRGLSLVILGFVLGV